MAEYYVEWTEHRKFRARIQAPPNDDRMLLAGVQVNNNLAFEGPTPEIIVWARKDGTAEEVDDGNGKKVATFDIHLIGKQVEIPAGKDLIEQRIVPL